MNATAYISDLSCHLPGRVVTNEDLHRENPEWDTERIASKTGIESRRIAADGETASDLAFSSAERLFAKGSICRGEIDYLLFCTQSPDYLLPASACILQDRLGLPVHCGAIDINQGCSGYVYGLQLANALIVSGTANSVLLLTGETYSKYIHPRDRSVRVLFGDAGTATVIGTAPRGARILTTVVGTDGSGPNNLIVPVGGARQPSCAASLHETCDDNGNVRTAANLFMDGQELFAFTLRRVPELIEALLAKGGLTANDVDAFVFHQANAFMNEHLRTKMRLPKEKVPLALRDVGNTVSNTLPLTLAQVGHNFAPGDKIALVGFGVGYSWGACLLEWGDVVLSNPFAVSQPGSSQLSASPAG
jgi:3-oxoacyl-[acyl-carrier-protein] synthase-3